MHSGQLVFAQVMTYLPLKAFSRMVQARRAQHKFKDFSCLDQFLALSFAQLTARESLRDIEINLRVQRQHFYHLGVRCKTIARHPGQRQPRSAMASHKDIKRQEKQNEYYDTL
jgi:hypothetical protein